VWTFPVMYEVAVTAESFRYLFSFLFLSYIRGKGSGSRCVTVSLLELAWDTLGFDGPVTFLFEESDYLISCIDAFYKIQIFLTLRNELPRLVLVV
jgi:hypothetical protein